MLPAPKSVNPGPFSYPRDQVRRESSFTQIGWNNVVPLLGTIDSLPSACLCLSAPSHPATIHLFVHKLLKQVCQGYRNIMGTKLSCYQNLQHLKSKCHILLLLYSAHCIECIYMCHTTVRRAQIPFLLVLCRSRNQTHLLPTKPLRQANLFLL